MDRTQGENYIVVGGKRQFTDGPPGTTISADYMNALQEELMTVIQNAGLTPSSTDNTQLYQAFLQLGDLIFRDIVLSNWTSRTNPKNFILRGITAGNTNAMNTVAVGADDGADGYIVYSATGLLWTEATNPKNAYLTSVCYASALGYYVAVGEKDGADAYILYSTNNGVSWTEMANPKNFDLYGVCYVANSGACVAVGEADGADAYIVYWNGVWTEAANPKNINLNAVVGGGDGRLVAVGAADGVDAYIVYSDNNGVTWTEAANPKNYTLEGVAYSPTLGLYVAVGQDDTTDAYIIYSPDGINWTEAANPLIGVTLYGICWDTGANLFIAVGSNGAIIVSANGISWTRKYVATNNSLRAVCKNHFCALIVGAATGVQAELWTSLFS